MECEVKYYYLCIEWNQIRAKVGGLDELAFRSFLSAPGPISPSSLIPFALVTWRLLSFRSACLELSFLMRCSCLYFLTRRIVRCLTSSPVVREVKVYAQLCAHRKWTVITAAERMGEKKDSRSR